MTGNNLLGLTADDLRDELGVTSRLQQKRILDAVAQLICTEA